MLTPELQARLRAAGRPMHQWIDQFSTARVAVVGDLTLDEFLTGQVERVSREAPVVILRHESTRQVPGAGANAAYNLASLGAQVEAIGLIGADMQGEALGRIFREAGIGVAGLVVDPGRPTVTKTRIAGHARQSVTQQIVRVDRKSDIPPGVAVWQAVAAVMTALQGQVDALLCSDYGEGVMGEPVIQAALGYGRVLVDTQKDPQRYRGAWLFTPNLPEAEAAVGYTIGDETTLQAAGRDLLAQTAAQHVLITRGEEGMSLFSADGGVEHLPAFNRTDVFDVTGAGDTVVATITLATVAGATPWEAMVLGNLAASLVVRQFGTATTTQAELHLALDRLLAPEVT